MAFLDRPNRTADKVDTGARPASGRVILRHVEAADESDFLAMTRASQALHAPWVYPPLTRMTFRQYLARTERDDHEGLLACRREDGALVGVFNINNIVRGTFLSASIGYYGAARYGGMGYMQEGLDLLKRYASLTLGLHRIEANIQPGNQRSRALAQRCGFQLEGLSPAFLFIDGAWRDHERWTWIHDRQRLAP